MQPRIFDLCVFFVSKGNLLDFYSFTRSKPRDYLLKQIQSLTKDTKQSSNKKKTESKVGRSH